MKDFAYQRAPGSEQGRAAADLGTAQRKVTAGPFANGARLTAQRRAMDQLGMTEPVQRVAADDEEEPVQAKRETVQRMPADEEEEPPLQGRFADAAVQLQHASEDVTVAQAKADEANGGLPAHLRSGIEAMSGMDMSGVRVHRNSSQPAQLNALAYAQGNDIHLGPGQEQHLPHEAWHVVQQRQGRVRETVQMAGVGVNDEVGLEREADLMGGRAVLQAVGLGSEGKRQDPAPTARIAGAPTAQLFGSIRFSNLDGSKLDYTDKAREIINTLEKTPKIKAFLQAKNVLITLELDSRLAAVQIVGDQVQITLSPWFFEQQTSGRIIGMLAHEFGAHPLAREQMTPNEITDESAHITVNTAFPTGIPGHTITPGAAGQTDHVFAAVSGQPRFNHYRRTVHEAVSQMYLQSRERNATMTLPKIKEAIMTYLADVAMILATNDHRDQIISSPARVATCFNLERKSWLTFLSTEPDPNNVNLALADKYITPDEQSWHNVLAQVGRLACNFVASIADSSVDNDRLQQGTIGGLADITPVQTEVLADYGVTPQAKGSTATLFDALDGCRNVTTSCVDAIAGLTKYRTVHLQPGDAEYKRLQAVEDIFQSKQKQFTMLIEKDHLSLLGFSLKEKIRLILPNGRVMFGDDNGGSTVVHTILHVEKPDPHYRFAS